MNPAVAYRGYSIRSIPKKTAGGRWSVAVALTAETGGEPKTEKYFAEDGISYILEIEACKEGLNLGRNLIDRRTGRR
ncbi:MAG: hypothetical protein A2Z99_04065 [Treponema sp. GWB1_62_6]|nr:MAG: hypothetical protein A2Z99_04065 [Treponema sp. GWB1_62_6]OHE69564.1 MAG: hypothetical protein A2001_02970 [Treponema sp. GWC1_61_84]HCM26942.1 hypothetical protein [Treponema sp.]